VQATEPQVVSQVASVGALQLSLGSTRPPSSAIAASISASSSGKAGNCAQRARRRSLLLHKISVAVGSHTCKADASSGSEVVKGAPCLPPPQHAAPLSPLPPSPGSRPSFPPCCALAAVAPAKCQSATKSLLVCKACTSAATSQSCQYAL